MTDDEARPVAGASVSLVEPASVVRTDVAGGFEFRNVPVGDYTLLVDRLGYESRGMRTTVTADATTELTFALVAIVVEDPYYLTYVHVAQHHVGETYLGWTNSIVSDENDVFCSGCEWTDMPPQGATWLVYEVFGRHSVANPSGDGEYVWFFDTGNRNGSFVHSTVAVMPIWASVDEDTIDGIENFWFQIMCETTWVCIEERRDAFVTFFYSTPEEPEGFTAGPEE